VNRSLRGAHFQVVTLLAFVIVLSTASSSQGSSDSSASQESARVWIERMNHALKPGAFEQSEVARRSRLLRASSGAGATP